MSERPIRILFDANSLMVQKTGIGYYTAGLVGSLAAAAPEMRFVGYYYNFLGRKRPPSSPQAPNLTYRPIYHAPGPAVNLLRRWGVEVPVELLAATRADFVLYPNFLGQPSLFRVPNAPVIHDLMYYDHPEWGSDKAVRDLRRFVPRSLRRASFIITVSDFSKRRLIDGYTVAPERVITTFIPPAAAHTVSQSQAEKLLSRQGITKPFLLFIGTMEPRKNIINLMEAYRLLPDGLRRGHSLVLAGKLDWKYHDTKARLEQLQADGYNIRYLGYIDEDLRDALYRRARLFVMASHYEGFGMQTLEALSYGTACAVSDIPVFREVGGGVVAYFDHRDPAAMAAVIAGCLRQPPPDPAALRRYVEHLPDWPAVAEDVLLRIRRALARGKRAKT